MIKRNRNISAMWMPIIIGCIFSLFTVSGMWTRQDSDSPYGLYFWLVLFVFYMSLYSVVTGFLMYHKNKIKVYLEKTTFRFNKIIDSSSWNRERAVVFGGFLLLYLPAFLAYFPGIFGYDGPVQIFQFFSDATPVTAHHPLAHTYLLAICFKLGFALTKDYNAGLGIYCFLQSVVMAWIFTDVILWMRKRRIAAVWCIGAFLFWAFNPIVLLLNINTTKDTLFSGFFLEIYIHLIDWMEKPKQDSSGKQNWKKYIMFFLLAIGMCVFRNQGYMLLAFVGVFSVFLFWKTSRRISAVILTSALVGVFLMGPFVDMLGVPKGDSREMLSVPMQQLAYAWTEDSLGTIELDEEEKDKIEALIPVEFLTNYHADNADYVKSGFDTETLKSDASGYLKLYLKIGSRYPVLYLRAFTNLVSGYWDLEQSGSFRNQIYSNAVEDPFYNVCSIQRNSLLPSFERGMSGFVKDLKSFPVFRIVFSHVLPVWIMAALMIWSLYKKKRAIFGSTLLLLGQWCIMLLSPAMLVRYAYPLIVCLPVMAVLFLEE